ncbi:MAG TPA: CocE/NonD family hydrolase [Thermoanaerobaculaceae bacterium]|nr:CocE/NonD family hydrolase [Thermoanaerobaculaceae bacterium]HRS16934.1 CocE/NonD family hydrolase [Thermoanaerobaculaceae bacterium]
MPSHRSCRAVLAVLGVAWAAGAAAPAQGQTPAEMFVTMPDGVRLATDIYLPVGHGWGPWPVILQRTPYGKRSALSANTCLAWWAQGFVCVAQDVRGTGRSEGHNTVFRDDRVDGQATIEWITRQSWSNDRIGTFGGSALGITEYALAPGAPAALKCQLPVVATADFYHHAAFAGGALRYGLAHPWLAGQGSLDFYEQLRQHRLWDAWWEETDVVSHVGTIDVPGLHVGGWYDIFLQGTLDAFRLIQHHGGPNARGAQKLVVGPWTHTGLGGTQAGQLTYPANAVSYGELLTDWRDWFVHHLQGGKPAVASWPPVRIYLMGAAGEPGAPGNQWLALQDWPPPSWLVPLYFDASGGLDRALPAAGERAFFADPANPVPTRGGANLFETVDGAYQGIGPEDQRPIEARDDVLVFSTPALAAPLPVVGPLRAVLWVRPDTRDLDLAVRLADVYPDGRSMLVVDGIARARMRCGADRECLLTPGQAVEVEVDLTSTALVVNVGHRLRISVSGSNRPRFEVNPNTGGDLNSPGQGTVAHPVLLVGPTYPSRLEVPVLRSSLAPRRRLGPGSAGRPTELAQPAE